MFFKGSFLVFVSEHPQVPNKLNSSVLRVDNVINITARRRAIRVVKTFSCTRQFFQSVLRRGGSRPEFHDDR